MGKQKDDNSIKVGCRFRPLNASEQTKTALKIQFTTDQQLILPRQPENLVFNFDHIFSPESKQEQLYETAAKPVIESVL